MLSLIIGENNGKNVLLLLGEDYIKLLFLTGRNNHRSALHVYNAIIKYISSKSKFLSQCFTVLYTTYSICTVIGNTKIKSQVVI